MGRAVENVKSCMHIMWNKKVFVCSLAWDDSIIFCLCHPNTQIFCFAQICLFSIVGVFLHIGNAIQQCIWLYSIFYIELYLYFKKTPGFGLLKPHYLWVSNVAVYYFVMWSAINWSKYQYKHNHIEFFFWKSSLLSVCWTFACYNFRTK